MPGLADRAAARRTRVPPVFGCRGDGPFCTRRRRRAWVASKRCESPPGCICTN